MANSQALEFEVVATDAEGNVGKDRVIVSVIDRVPDSSLPDSEQTNLPPIVDIPLEITGSVGEMIELNGSRSQDLDGTIDTYLWEQVSGINPANDAAVNAVLANADTHTATFVAPQQVAEFVFRLTCTDNDGLSASATIVVHVFTTDPAPSVPRNLFVTAVSTSAIGLIWTQPLNYGAELPNLRYQVERSRDERVWMVLTNGTTSQSYADTGLVENTSYYYRVRAEADGGHSDWVYGNDTTESDPLAPPEISFQWVYPDVGRVGLAFDVPDGEGITHVDYRYADSYYNLAWNPGAWIRVPAPFELANPIGSAVFWVPNLMEGVGYNFECRAVNANDIGTNSVHTVAIPIAERLSQTAMNQIYNRVTGGNTTRIAGIAAKIFDDGRPWYTRAGAGRAPISNVIAQADLTIPDNQRGVIVENQFASAVPTHAFIQTVQITMENTTRNRIITVGAEDAGTIVTYNSLNRQIRYLFPNGSQQHTDIGTFVNITQTGDSFNVTLSGVGQYAP